MPKPRAAEKPIVEDFDNETEVYADDSRFRIVEGSDIGYGPSLESVNDEKFDKLEAEKNFKVVDGSDIGYGPSIVRKSEAVAKDELLATEIVEEEKLLSAYLNKKFEEPELTPESFLLSEQQRNQLRTTLAALGFAVIPATAAYDHFSKDENQLEISASDDTSPYNENYTIEQTDAFGEGVKYNKAENVLEVKPVKQPEVIKPVVTLEAAKVVKKYETPKSYEKMDAFEKDVERFSKLLGEDYIEVIKEHADKPVIGAEGHTRMQYVQEEIKFAKWNEKTGEGVPPAVENELRRILPGLCAQESRFDNGLISNTGAKGILQFMPETWAEYGGKPGEHTSLKKQVEIAGLHFSKIYKQVIHHVGDESLQKLRSRYSSEQSFQRDLIVPLMINSYNTGSSRMAEAVKFYLARTPAKKIPTGKELYVAIADYAKSSREGEHLSGYKEHSREYVPRIYAQAEILNKNEEERERRRARG